MKKLLGILDLGLLLSGNAFANERFIPLELFTGGKIRGLNEITFSEANITFGKRDHKRITGPMDWKNPMTGETIKVYKRTNKSNSGKVKTQLFTVTNDNQCIGRVWDSRYNAVIKNGCKFPLGIWKKDESRTFTSTRACGKSYTQVIKIIKLGKKAKSCVTFRWTLSDAASTIDDNTYTYCPNKSMSNLVEH